MLGAMTVSVVPLLVAAGCVLIGALAAWTGARQLVRVGRDRRRFERAPGEVVEVLQNPSTDGSTYHAVVRFRTADGRSVRAVSRYGDRSPGVAPGATVTVYYDPANPKDVFLDGWWRSGIAMWSLGLGLGAAFMAFGLYGLLALKG